MNKNTFLVIILSAAILSSRVWAGETKPKSFEGIEFLAGFAWADLKEKEDYELCPLIVDFDFDLKPLAKKFNLRLKQLFQLQIEPFISFVSQPDANIETGTSFLLKLGLSPQTAKFQPYVKAGLGMVYMTQHTREQGTQFNFTEQLGLGAHYFIKKNTAFTIEGRARHLSNSSIKEPNNGIDTLFVIAGISYRF